jgi:glycosyltransferase involved in cell wall biosynthesis
LVKPAVSFSGRRVISFIPAFSSGRYPFVSLNLYNASVNTKLNSLSVFFPLYNEEENVARLVEESLRVFPQVAEKYEIILVNDGSSDKTQEIAEKLVSKHKEVCVVTQENMGYGGALKRGFKECKNEWTFYSDGDLQFDLHEIEKFIPHTAEFDFIIGYRKKRIEGYKRKALMILLKIWNKVFLGLPLNIKDVDCGFKLLNTQKLAELGPLLTNGAMLETEFMLRGHLKKYRIKQLGVTHRERLHGSSTGDDPKVVFRAVKETFGLAKRLGTLDNLILKLLPVFLFLLVLPLSLDVDYMQNDEYTHYRLVEKFSTGNFQLDEYVGATFYLQGFLGLLFAKVFGFSHLPVLTLLVSVAAVYVFSQILHEQHKVGLMHSLLLSILLFVSPLVLYSSVGFMTENYFLFFFMVSLYYLYAFLNSNHSSSFWLSNVFILLSYFVRQLAFATSFAFFVSLLFEKKYKWAFVQLGLFFYLIGFHFFVFPRTPQMYSSSFNPLVLLDMTRTYALGRVFLSYLGVFFFPLLVFKVVKNLSFKRVLLALPLTILLLVFFNGAFKPGKVISTSRERSGRVQPYTVRSEFPYLGNIFERESFFATNLPGTKYHYPGYFDLFKTFEFVGHVSFWLFIFVLLLNIRSLKSFSMLYMCTFFSLLVLVPRIYDRYLIAALPVFILFSLAGRAHTNKKFSRVFNISIGLYILLFSFLGYQYTMDLHHVNKYVWGRSEELVLQGVPRNRIKGGNSWVNLYAAENRTWAYFFVYPQNYRVFEHKYKIVDEHVVTYPLNFYRDSKIYLIRNTELPSYIE